MKIAYLFFPLIRKCMYCLINFRNWYLEHFKFHLWLNLIFILWNATYSIYMLREGNLLLCTKFSRGSSSWHMSRTYWDKRYYFTFLKSLDKCNIDLLSSSSLLLIVLNLLRLFTNCFKVFIILKNTACKWWISFICIILCRYFPSVHYFLFLYVQMFLC